MHSVIVISIRNIESKRNIEQNKFTNCNNLFPNPIFHLAKINALFFITAAFKCGAASNFAMQIQTVIYVTKFF